MARDLLVSSPTTSMGSGRPLSEIPHSLSWGLGSVACPRSCAATLALSDVVSFCCACWLFLAMMSSPWLVGWVNGDSFFTISILYVTTRCLFNGACGRIFCELLAMYRCTGV